MSGRIVDCRLCGRRFKVPAVIHMVFPPGYDHSCCAECNAEVKDAPLFQPVEPKRRDVLKKTLWSAPTITLLLAASVLPTQAVAGSGAYVEPEPPKRGRVPQWLQRHPSRRLWRG